MRASSTVGAGRPDQRNGGGTSWSSQVNPIGIIAPGAKAGLVSRIRCRRASTATTRRTARRLGAAAVDEADVGEEDPRRADQVVDAPNRERWAGETAPSEPQRHAATMRSGPSQIATLGRKYQGRTGVGGVEAMPTASHQPVRLS
jgi:hypothetical protein